MSENNRKAEDGMFHGTTILCVRKDGKVVMAGDGQVTMNNTVVKAGAKKVRRLSDYNILAGFAGSTADAFTLIERFEEKLRKYSGNLTRSAVELAKEWRSDKFLRRLEALLLVADKERTYMISGMGDVIEPDTGVIAIGSGGSYAYAAARALTENTAMEARAVAEESMKIAADICVFTNHNLQIEEIA